MKDIDNTWMSLLYIFAQMLDLEVSCESLYFILARFRYYHDACTVFYGLLSHLEVT